VAPRNILCFCLQILEVSQNILAVHYSEELAFVKQYILTKSVEKTASFQYRMFVQ
jgi:hypothetical protein